MTPDQVGLAAGFVFTLMIFSYLLGDNFLYRLAIYVFAGLAAGYITVLTVESVILPWVRGTIGSGQFSGILIGIVPIVLGALLLTRTFRRYHKLGNLALGLIIGVGAAVGIIGAVSGTLIPVMNDTINVLRPQASGDEAGIALFNGFLVVGGVICTLVYFGHFGRRMPDGTVRRGAFGRTLGAVGQGFVVIALGALYGGAILTGLAILTERLAFIFTTIGGS
ncbi:MAG: hypothetical protein UZ15_CFX003001200 [Chloroflexi bacterium OLB15]|nr:MAG: hypothetical protein UZ15_CFX003001200 [Chloroflexi bacterium OLB15]